MSLRRYWIQTHTPAAPVTPGWTGRPVESATRRITPLNKLAVLPCQIGEGGLTTGLLSPWSKDLSYEQLWGHDLYIADDKGPAPGHRAVRDWIDSQPCSSSCALPLFTRSS